VAQALAAQGQVKAVGVVHAETSTGVQQFPESDHPE